MPKTVAIGIQDFQYVRENNCFYVDKTHFVTEWWNSSDVVTLITRPRRFGKTLLLSTVEHFLSNRYDNQAQLFDGLAVCKDGVSKKLQGAYPVIFISFGSVKEPDYALCRLKLAQLISNIYSSYEFLMEGNTLTEKEKTDFRRVTRDMDDVDLTSSLERLSWYLYKYYGRKAVILLDEYDTPMQEAYVNGFWDQIVSLFRTLFNATFKDNKYLERALLTGITRVSRESIFSDLNNLRVITTTSNKYADCFGFTEEEVFAALEEYGYPDRAGIEKWYDGFTFGSTAHIYNPWSILNYLQEGKLTTYWANTSSNSLVAHLLRSGDRRLKADFEQLLNGGTITSVIDEQIVYGEMKGRSTAVWSLLLASGYLKVVFAEGKQYTLALTNHEVEEMFETLVTDWFEDAGADYNDFITALLTDDIDAMNLYMNRVALATFSSFDTGRHPSGDSEPERFYHGFVLGLLVELKGRYYIRSNRESGFGRYDIMLEPDNINTDPGIVIEFKVFNPRKEKDLEETVSAARKQIADRNYAEELKERGVPEEQIRIYGFAFRGKEVLIG